MTAFPAGVRTAPPPPLPPAAVSTSGVPRLRLSSSTSSQVRRYDIRKARPAAEIEPERAISSSTATLPGPIRAPETRSSRMLSRSVVREPSGGLGFFFPMADTSGLAAESLRGKRGLSPFRRQAVVAPANAVRIGSGLPLVVIFSRLYRRE